MSANLEKAIFYIVETYLASEIVTKNQAAEVLERVLEQVIQSEQ